LWKNGSTAVIRFARHPHMPDPPAGTSETLSAALQRPETLCACLCPSTFNVTSEEARESLESIARHIETAIAPLSRSFPTLGFLDRMQVLPHNLLLTY
jgi:hypothetical protein